ncbi:MAG TPA: hypothetical protein VGM12_24485 [Trebonia sp.]|jgi:hypothetical protein
MSGDLPWNAPARYVVTGRRWTYAPPPRIMYEAIVDETGEWLSPLPGETAPRVAASRRPEAVLLRPWVDAAVTAVELRIEPHGPGAAITVLAYGDVPRLPDEIRRRVRHRMGTAFGGALRYWVDRGL